LEVTNAYALHIQTAYTRALGLQLKTTKTASAFYHVMRVRAAADYCRIGYNIVYGLGAYTGAGIHLEGNIGTCVWNNLSYSNTYNAHASNHGIGTETDQGKNYFYNNTTIGWYYGYQIYSTNYSVFINNIAKGSNSTAFVASSFPATSDYNSTDKAAATGGDHDRVNQTFAFVDEGNLDFHLAYNDGGARGHGYSDPGSGLFSDDIDGVARSGNWDIGADQYVASGLALPVVQNYQNCMRG
jgi:hypothetical protein